MPVHFLLESGKGFFVKKDGVAIGLDVYKRQPLVLSLMIMRKKFVAPYLFSFVVGFAFSEMLDVHEMWIGCLLYTSALKSSSMNFLKLPSTMHIRLLSKKKLWIYIV